MDTAKTYNGWANYETWNVALWISNDYGLYNAACDFMRYGDNTDEKNPYEEFVHFMGVDWSETPDGVDWLSDELDYDELNAFMREFSEED